jgi:hypothetical protein
MGVEETALRAEPRQGRGDAVEVRVGALEAGGPGEGDAHARLTPARVWAASAWTVAGVGGFGMDRRGWGAGRRR